MNDQPTCACEVFIGLLM